jgi:hypothetical protein
MIIKKTIRFAGQSFSFYEILLISIYETSYLSAICEVVWQQVDGNGPKWD